MTRILVRVIHWEVILESIDNGMGKWFRGKEANTGALANRLPLWQGTLESVFLMFAPFLVLGVPFVLCLREVLFSCSCISSIRTLGLLVPWHLLAGLGWRYERGIMLLWLNLSLRQVLCLWVSEVWLSEDSCPISKCLSGPSMYSCPFPVSKECCCCCFLHLVEMGFHQGPKHNSVYCYSHSNLRLWFCRGNWGKKSWWLLFPSSSLHHEEFVLQILCNLLTRSVKKRTHGCKIPYIWSP